MSEVVFWLPHACQGIGVPQIAHTHITQQGVEDAEEKSGEGERLKMLEKAAL